MITKNPDIIGGDACIQGTRIPVWCIASWRYKHGRDLDWIKKECYPHLSLEEMQEALSYYQSNRKEVSKEYNRHSDDDINLWEHEYLTAIDEMILLKDGWNGYGPDAPKPAYVAIRSAELLVGFLQEYPFIIAPSAVGGVVVSISKDDRTVCIEFLNNEEIRFLRTNPENPDDTIIKKADSVYVPEFRDLAEEAFSYVYGVR